MPAPYALAIDIGTSRTAAATARTTPAGDVACGSLTLGRASDSAPTAVYVGEGELLFGDAAERRGAARPDRLVREFKRRVGDDVPIVAGDRRFDAEELYALVAGWVASVATEREGRPPERIALTVPVSWGTYRTGLVSAALARHGWPEVDILSEPEAAARHYETTHPLDEGHALAVYDLGGGTFDAVVLTKTADGVRVAGSPAGIPDLGGADFDDAVLRYVVGAAGLSTTTLAGSPGGRLALAALRRECVEAKESLSFDSDVTVTAIVDGEHTSVRLPRDEFEAMIDDDLERTASILADGIEQARMPLADVDAILLTGGSSRIPRIAQLLSERFDRPIAVDADPKGIIALGAARAALPAAAIVETDADAAPAADDEEVLAGVPAFREPAPKRSWFRRVPPVTYAAGACALLLTGIGLAAAPTLGTTMIFAEAASTSEPQAIDASLLALSDPLGAAIAPVVAPLPSAPETSQKDTTPRTTPTTPRKQTAGRTPKARSTASEQRSTPRSTANPTGGSGTSGGGGSAGPASTGSSTPATGGSSTPSTPVNQPDPAPVDPAPVDPAPVDPAPVDPTPVDPTPAPVDPTPAPVDPTPTPEPTSDPAPAPAEPAPETTPAPGEPVA